MACPFPCPCDNLHVALGTTVLRYRSDPFITLEQSSLEGSVLGDVTSHWRIPLGVDEGSYVWVISPTRLVFLKPWRGVAPNSAYAFYGMPAISL